MSQNSSNQFERITIEVGKKGVGYRAFTAIWNHRSGHIAISAPSMEGLKHRWTEMTNSNLNEAMVQEVFLCSVKIGAAAKPGADS